MKKYARHILATVVVILCCYWVVRKIDSPPSIFSRTSSSFGYTYAKGGFCLIEEHEGDTVFLLISTQPRDDVAIKTNKDRSWGVDCEIVTVDPHPGWKRDVRLGRIPTVILVTPGGRVWSGRYRVTRADFQRLNEAFSKVYKIPGEGVKPTVHAVLHFFSETTDRQWPETILSGVRELKLGKG